MDDWQWVADPQQSGSNNVDMPGIIHWPPDSAAIPAGLTDWLGMPTSQYCPMYSAANDYIADSHRYNYTWAVDVNATVGPTAIPIDAQFYRDAFANGSHAQMKMFEQVTLHTFECSNIDVRCKVEHLMMSIRRAGLSVHVRCLHLLDQG
jgi:hypothetical protein